MLECCMVAKISSCRPSEVNENYCSLCVFAVERYFDVVAVVVDFQSVASVVVTVIPQLGENPYLLVNALPRMGEIIAYDLYLVNIYVDSKTWYMMTVVR